MKTVMTFLFTTLVGVPALAAGYVWQWAVNGFVTGRKAQLAIHGDGK